MIDNPNFDFIFHKMYKLVKDKPFSFYFSQMPEQLSDLIINEFCEDDRNKYYTVLIDDYYRTLIHKLSSYIRSVKKNNQLVLLDTQKNTKPFSFKILESIKREFPKAFSKRRFRTRNRYGVKQVKIEFPEPKAPTLLENASFLRMIDAEDENSYNNPLMSI